MAEQWNSQSFKKSAKKHYKACTYLLNIDSIKQEYKNQVYSDVYYLCGYVIECALKYYIMQARHYNGVYSKIQLDKKGLKTHCLDKLYTLASEGGSPIGFQWKDLSSSIKHWEVKVRYNESNSSLASEIPKIKSDIDLVYNSVFEKF